MREKEAKEAAQPEYFSALSCPQIPLESQIKPKHCLLILAICYLSPPHLCCLHGLGMNPLLSPGKGTVTLLPSPKRLDGKREGGGQGRAAPGLPRCAQPPPGGSIAPAQLPARPLRKPPASL